MERARIDSIMFMHADIQGAEEFITEDCANLISQDKLENLYIGTQGLAKHENVRRALQHHSSSLSIVLTQSHSESPAARDAHTGYSRARRETGAPSLEFGSQRQRSATRGFPLQSHIVVRDRTHITKPFSN